MAKIDDIATLEGASAIAPIDAPGRGRRVTLHDPDGFRIDIVHGIAAVAGLPMREPPEYFPGSPEYLSVWGPPAPADFLD